MRWVALLLVIVSLVGCTFQTNKPTKDTETSRYVSREQAVEAALQSIRNVKAKDVVFVESHQLETKGRQVLAAWVVELIGKDDNRPTGRPL